MDCAFYRCVWLWIGRTSNWYRLMANHTSPPYLLMLSTDCNGSDTLGTIVLMRGGTPMERKQVESVFKVSDSIKNHFEVAGWMEAIHHGAPVF